MSGTGASVSPLPLDELCPPHRPAPGRKGGRAGRRQRKESSGRASGAPEVRSPRSGPHFLAGQPGAVPAKLSPFPAANGSQSCKAAGPRRPRHSRSRFQGKGVLAAHKLGS